MKNINIKLLGLLLFLIPFVITSCDDDDGNTKFVPPVTEEPTDEIDIYLNKNMLEKYNTAVRWRWEDWFIDDDYNATPVMRDVVIPVTELLEYLWVDPYREMGEGGEEFILDLFPPELVYIGSYIFKNDGTRLLGYAEGGARVTLLNLNDYDLTNRVWLTNPTGGILATVHHEFSHIVHQNHGFPAGFESVSSKYTGAGWSNGVSNSDALKMGMVSPYGTSNKNEDFCELISHFLVMPKAEFEAAYITLASLDGITDPGDIADTNEENAGRLLIAKKLEMVADFYMENFDIDLYAVRDLIGERIEYVVTNNKIPEDEE
jgi:substrate import-associated zinc metallohydrolase lipoprotein